MEEAQKISRRTFLKLAGLVGLDAVTGGTLPTQAQSPSSAKEEQEIQWALPKKEDKSRMWAEDKPAHAPPPTYRSAIAYDSKNDRWVLHGGYIGRETNHNQTWVYKNGDWTKIEEGSTKAVYGHSIIDTPAGLVMFGGVEILPNKKESAISNEFRILKEDATGVRWEKFVPETPYNKPIPSLQGIGSVYDPGTESIWILGGADLSHDKTSWILSNTTFQLYLPGKYSKEKDWYLRGIGYQGQTNYYAVVQPLVFMQPGDEKIYLYGGIGYDRGGGVGIFSNELWTIKPVETNIEVTAGNWPKADYAGEMHGGFDASRNQMVLHSGRATFFFGPDWQESVVYDVKNSTWAQVASINYPPTVVGPTVAMNPKTREFLRFGGASYNSNTKEWEYSHQTWRCSPVYTLRFPIMYKQGK